MYRSAIATRKDAHRATVTHVTGYVDRLWSKWRRDFHQLKFDPDAAEFCVHAPHAAESLAEVSI